MPWWGILLIVIGSLIVLFSIFIICILNYAGKQMVKTLGRCDEPGKGIGKGMDISFYDKGPLRKMAEEGVAYLKTLEYEDLYLESFDGLKLHAFVFKNPNKETNKYFLGMHGFRSGALHEYGPYAKKYIELGFNLVLVDERAHYRSEGTYITMGMNERFDARDWANLLVKKYGENIQILMQGVSMGAATVCLASNLDLPSQVIGIISDCAYSSYKEEIKSVLKNMMKTDNKYLLNYLSKYIKKHTGVDFETDTPLKAVKEAKVPMMFAHGELDEIVPVSFVDELYDACCSRKIKLTNKDANHAETMARDVSKYFDTIVEFFDIK